MIANPKRAALGRKSDAAGSGKSGANEAFSRTAGSVFNKPRQFGPTMRMPWPRTFSKS